LEYFIPFFVFAKALKHAEVWRDHSALEISGMRRENSDVKSQAPLPQLINSTTNTVLAWIVCKSRAHQR